MTNPRPQTALIFGISGTGWSLLGGVAASARIRSPRHLARQGKFELLQPAPSRDLRSHQHHSAVLDDFRSVVSVIKNVSPAHIYNLAAQSSVGLSFEQPVETIDSIMHGTINIMEAMRFLSLDAKFYNAGLERVLRQHREGTSGRREHSISAAKPIRSRQGGLVLGGRQLS